MKPKHLLGMLAAGVLITLVVLLVLFRPVSSATPTAAAPEVAQQAAQAPAVPGAPAPIPPPEKRVDTTKPSVHGSGIDRSMATVLAMMNAPEGKTPCETAWNATVAEREAAQRLGKKSVFLRVAPQEEFMRLCYALPAEAQPCASPRYLAKNRERCEAVRPPRSQIKAMAEMRPGINYDQDAENDRQLDEEESAAKSGSTPNANVK